MWRERWEEVEESQNHIGSVLVTAHSFSAVQTSGFTGHSSSSETDLHSLFAPLADPNKYAVEIVRLCSRRVLEHRQSLAGVVGAWRVHPRDLFPNEVADAPYPRRVVRQGSLCEPIRDICRMSEKGMFEPDNCQHEIILASLRRRASGLRMDFRGRNRNWVQIAKDLNHHFHRGEGSRVTSLCAYRHIAGAHFLIFSNSGLPLRQGSNL